MNSSRLEQLHNFLEQEPNDPFTKYAIATEYLKIDPLKALQIFEGLLNAHPEYLATYYHIAQLYIEIGKTEQVKHIFEKGIELAKKQENSLALRELQNAYNNFMFDE